jgi:flagellar hook assembly protein FlgD
VKTVVDGEVGPGRHAFEWDGRDEAGQEVAAGTYFYRLVAAGISYSRKAILAR